MITRLALFTGTITPGKHAAMREYVEQKLAPLWRQFDGAANVRVLFHVKQADNQPAIPLALQVDYNTADDIARALASPARYKSRDMLPEFYAKFWDDVRLDHHEFVVQP